MPEDNVVIYVKKENVSPQSHIQTNVKCKYILQNIDILLLTCIVSIFCESFIRNIPKKDLRVLKKPKEALS